MNFLSRVALSLALASTCLMSLPFDGYARGGGRGHSRSGSVRVRGYYKKNGTYVAPHYRSAPDGNPYNNWSYPGNVNPYTGKVATGNPDTYLKNYDKKHQADATEPVPEFGSDQPETVPANAVRNSYGPGWTCSRGYMEKDGACEKVQIPEHAKLNYTGHSWECRRGYSQSGEECQAVAMPPNARLDYSGHAWECSRGYSQSGNECVKVSMPAHARLDYTGHAWECARGYQHSGSECAKVEIPPNAELDYTGHDWKCKFGFRRTDVGCARE